MGDGTPAVVTGVNTVAGMHDVLFFQTEHSHVLALDAHTGTQIWRVNLPTGCFKYTNSAVAVDPGLQYVYATGIDCKIHKLSVYDGSEVTTGGWPATAATSTGQKVSSELAIATDSVSGASYLYETIAYAGATACGALQEPTWLPARKQPGSSTQAAITCGIEQEHPITRRTMKSISRPLMKPLSTPPLTSGT